MQEAGHGAHQRFRGVPVDLPESGARDPVIVARGGLLHPGAAPQLQRLILERDRRLATETSAGSWARMVLSRLARVPGAGARSTSGRDPLAGAATSTRSMPCRSMSHKPQRVDALDRERHLPDRNDLVRTVRVHAELAAGGDCKTGPRPPREAGAAVVRFAAVRGGAAHRFHLGESSTPASRLSCSASTSDLRRRWRAREMWPSSAPPTGGCPCPHGAGESATRQKCGTRSGDGSRTSTTSARQNLADSPASVSRIRAFSPGMPWRTNTTRPSCRATQWPPWATGPMSTTSSAPAEEVSGSGFIGCPAVSLLLRMI